MQNARKLFFLFFGCKMCITFILLKLINVKTEEKISNCFFSKKYKHDETRTVFNSFIWESGDGD